MASPFPFHLAVALLLVLVHQQAAGEQHTFDLNKEVERFVKRKGKEVLREIVWWDVHGKQEEVKQGRRKYPPKRSVPYDMFMLLSLHSLRRTRMALRHADVTPRQARDYFFESVVLLRMFMGR
uniref:Putative secreted protein n=1 Tax=Ixodes scapularis TaxID=6945 RepID=A0A4D5RJE9_IXOSC